MMRLHFRVHGHVQGIGYRYFVIQTAKQLSLTGWVRNCSNGDVEGEAQGDEENLQNFLAQLENGHRWASVDRIAQEKILERPDEKEFQIRY